MTRKSVGERRKKIASNEFASAPGERPLRNATRAMLLARFTAAIRDADGRAGAHCIHELWMRSEIGFDVDAAIDALWRVAAKSIPEWLPMRYVDWLPTVYDVCARFSARSRGRSNVYLVLLDYADARGDPFGIYVGMTSYAPAQRFDQHKAGIRAAGSVLRRGLELLAGPTLHLRRISRADAARIERDLAIALGDAGLRVEGGH